ncbi:MAG: 50S ribosomal protein L13 [Chloroflexota bacterium]|nr:MAG: 50S ribosomal protein L13 [Chloroflexota bacterium]
MKYKTFVTKAADIEREWWIVDAQGQTLGRLATQIATILRGKNKPTFAPNIDVGDYVIVINAAHIVVTGNRLDDKKYYRHSGYNGGLTEITLRDQLQRRPERVIQAAVKGMLPKNALGRDMFSKLKVYAGSTHPHAAQQPKVLEL